MQLKACIYEQGASASAVQGVNINGVLLQQLVVLAKLASLLSMRRCTPSSEREPFLHETAKKKVCGLSRVTGSWFPQRQIVDEFFQMYCFGALCTASQVPSSPIIFERRQTSSWLISPKNSHQKHSKRIKKALQLTGKICHFDFGVNCRFKYCFYAWMEMWFDREK